MIIKLIDLNVDIYVKNYQRTKTKISGIKVKEDIKYKKLMIRGKRVEYESWKRRGLIGEDTKNRNAILWHFY